MFRENRLVRGMACLFAAILFAATLAAQQTGTVQGQVTDDTGAVIPGATVSLVNAQNKEKRINSDENGAFSFAGVPAGQYTIRVTTTGFAGFQKTGIDVSPGRPVS
jgi:Cna protein B-type domain.